MLENIPVNKLCWGACFIIILCTSCNGKAFGSVNNTDGKGKRGSEALYYLDSNKPSIVQSIESKDLIPEAKFVQVEITEVQNPKKYPVSFRVYYQLRGNEQIYLGSFSLYPADNPGKFIVATQGKIRNEGAIVLSLVIPEDFDRRDIIRVVVKRIKFLKE